MLARDIHPLFLRGKKILFARVVKLTIAISTLVLKLSFKDLVISSLGSAVKDYESVCLPPLTRAPAFCFS